MELQTSSYGVRTMRLTRRDEAMALLQGMQWQGEPHYLRFKQRRSYKQMLNQLQQITRTSNYEDYFNITLTASQTLLAQAAMTCFDAAIMTFDPGHNGSSSAYTTGDLERDAVGLSMHRELQS